jgi:hypothetical protein
MASYVVEVNECGIFASQLGAAWWAANVLARPIAARITWAFMGPGGGVAQIACADKEEATFVRDHMVGHGGIHRTHVKVRRLAVANG